MGPGIAISNISSEALFQLKPILCRAILGGGNKNLFKWSWSHDQDGGQANRQLDPLEILFSGTNGLMALKLDMWHRVL